MNRYKFFSVVSVILLIGLLAGVVFAQDTGEPPEPVTANDDWEPVVQEFDSVEMVLVPPGCFMMGSTDEQIGAAIEECEEEMSQSNCNHVWFEAEGPQHEICFDEPFWIDRYEVTNAQFAAFGGVAERESRWGDDDLPRENITWFEAYDFCALRDARLPTEAEWEYAARGPDGLIFPWRDEFDGARVNFCDQNCTFYWADETHDDGYANTAPVGSYEDGICWVGAYDMSGNEWEWVSTIYRDYPYVADDGRNSNNDTSSDRMLRGGSWGLNDFFLRAAFRHWNPPDLRYFTIGFRCARSYSSDS